MPARSGALASRALPDGRVLDVIPLTFGRARLGISRDLDTQAFTDQW